MIRKTKNDGVQAWQVLQGSFFLSDGRVFKVKEMISCDDIIVYRQINAGTEQRSVKVLDLHPIKINATWLTWLGFTVKGEGWIKGMLLYRHSDHTVFKLYQDLTTVHYTMRINVCDVHDLQYVMRSENVK